MQKFRAALRCGLRIKSDSFSVNTYFVSSSSLERIKTWAKLKTYSGYLLIFSREVEDGQEVGVMRAYDVSDGEVRPSVELTPDFLSH